MIQNKIMNKQKQQKLKSKTTLPGRLDGIVWTAIRRMMLDCDGADKYIEAIKRIARFLDREHTAWDIRQNIGWDEGCIQDLNGKLAYSQWFFKWTELATWLESGSKHPHSAQLPKRKINDMWFDFFLFSAKYILHRHSYAVGYADDIASYYDMLTEKQRSRLSRWLSDNITETDDLSCRKLAAAFDRQNWCDVTCKATAEQIQEWVERNNAITTSGTFSPIEKTVTCFMVDGRYYPLYDYFKGGLTSVINDFITNITKLEAKPKKQIQHEYHG